MRVRGAYNLGVIVDVDPEWGKVRFALLLPAQDRVLLPIEFLVNTDIHLPIERGADQGAGMKVSPMSVCACACLEHVENSWAIDAHDRVNALLELPDTVPPHPFVAASEDPRRKVWEHHVRFELTEHLRRDTV